MLSLSAQTNGKAASCTPNLLPCRIHQDGAVNTSERYWKPEEKAGDRNSNSDPESDIIDAATDGTHEAYFRGRRLKGRKVAVPKGFKGVFVQTASSGSQGSSVDVRDVMLDEEDEDGTAPEDVISGDMVESAGFDHIVIWGHESTAPDDDMFLKGMTEWTTFAQAVSVGRSDQAVNSLMGALLDSSARPYGLSKRQEACKVALACVIDTQKHRS